MMKPNNPIFKLLKQSDVLQQHLQDKQIFRLFLAGLAPDEVKLPYVVWQQISRNPLNTLGNRPKMDDYLIQIDVYSHQYQQAQAIAHEIERILETECRVRGSRIEQDPITKNFRVLLEIEMLNPRI